MIFKKSWFKTKHKSHRYRERFDGCQTGGGFGGYEKVKGLISTNLLLQNNHRGVKYSIGNTVNNVVTTMYGAKWVLHLSEWSLHKLCKCLTTRAETNIILNATITEINNQTNNFGRLNIFVP